MVTQNLNQIKLKLNRFFNAQRNAMNFELLCDIVIRRVEMSIFYSILNLESSEHYTF